MPPKSVTTKNVNKRNQKLSQDDTPCACNAILVARSEIGGEEEMKTYASDALEPVLQEEELHVEDVRGELFVGNRRGLSFAGRLCTLEEQIGEIPSLKGDITSLKEGATSHSIKIASLEDRVGSLTSCSLDAYKLLRNRFISTFKRDKLANATEADRRIIAEGNGWAHGGDAGVDAMLYQSQGSDRRRDASAYERLYGMDPLRVLSISHKATTDVLNVHAGIIASKHKVGSDEFYARFAEFIKLFKESDYDESYLDDGGSTRVTRAYWSFLLCAKDEWAAIIEASRFDL